MHDENRILELVKHFLIDAVIEGVFTEGWKAFYLLAFKLNAQDICHIAPGQGLLHVELNLYVELPDKFRKQRRRTAYHHFGAELLQRKDIRQDHARMNDVAHD